MKGTTAQALFTMTHLPIQNHSQKYLMINVANLKTDFYKNKLNYKKQKLPTPDYFYLPIVEDQTILDIFSFFSDEKDKISPEFFFFPNNELTTVKINLRGIAFLLENIQ